MENDRDKMSQEKEQEKKDNRKRSKQSVDNQFTYKV